MVLSYLTKDWTQKAGLGNRLQFHWFYCNDKGVIYGQVSDTGKWRFLLRHRIGGSAREEGSD